MPKVNFCAIILAMEEMLRDRVFRIFTTIILLVIIIGGLMMMYPNYCRAKALKAQNAELQERIESKKRDIAELNENQRRFRTDTDFVELIARQNRRVFPGELVFTFDEK